jgi:hypothetical protein
MKDARQRQGQEPINSFGKKWSFAAVLAAAVMLIFCQR